MNKRLLQASILLIAFLVSERNAFSQEAPTNILFIGNSFSGFNNMPKMVEAFADSASNAYEIAAHTPGGAFVKYIPQGTFAHANNPAVYDLIRSKSWNYIVVQDNQGFFIDPTIGYFHPDGLVIEGHAQLRDSLLASSNECGKLILFSGWVDKDPMAWAPEFDMATAQIANQRVFDQYQFLNSQINQVIAPIGMAWNYVLDELPDIELFAGDNYHPNYAGSYLTAATIYSLAFKEDPTNNTFNGSLDPALAKELRIRAYRAVQTYYEESNQQTITPIIHQEEDHLVTADSFDIYTWYKEGTLIEGAGSSSILAESNSCYYVIVTDANGCSWKSFDFCTEEVSVGIDNADLDLGTVRIHPNPATDFVTIDCSVSPKRPKHGSIIDINGRIVVSFDLTKPTETVDISSLQTGLYIIRFNDGSNFKIIKK